MKIDQAQIPLAITSGEPAGIGLDICLGILDTKFDYPIEILVDFESLEQRAKELKRYEFLYPYFRGENPNITFKNISVREKVISGQLNVKNASYVLALLDQAVEGIENGVYAGIVTCPIHKGIINASGIPFTGHTEYFQNKAGVEKVVMMLSDGQLNVALVTTHLPLSQVAKTISSELIIKVVRIINQEFKSKFKIHAPRILVTGLNPHAGENGYLGMEEIDVIIPAITHLKNENILVFGPYSSDTVFQKELIESSDVILTMYHDQGLPVIKYASFEKAVNITLGLPYVRTSVDHGTALELAGTGKANASSLIHAINVASHMI
ncbi:MAG: 4-hydroxythreonine-4-phosphate dehydrogenase PdxA [Neisseriaceae bacterium]|nr:MAG: 4-hydroxythreonine-4-phosphate dehydrogenase PdxA [Neisseriaceae bacterium]